MSNAAKGRIQKGSKAYRVLFALLLPLTTSCSLLFSSSPDVDTSKDGSPLGRDAMARPCGSMTELKTSFVNNILLGLYAKEGPSNADWLSLEDNALVIDVTHTQSGSGGITSIQRYSPPYMIDIVAEVPDTSPTSSVALTLRLGDDSSSDLRIFLRYKSVEVFNNLEGRVDKHKNLDIPVQHIRFRHDGAKLYLEFSGDNINWGLLKKYQGSRYKTDAKVRIGGSSDGSFSAGVNASVRVTEVGSGC